MTVIAALHQDGETWIGSDRAWVSGERPSPCDLAKWASLDGRWLACSGNGATLSTLLHDPERFIGADAFDTAAKVLEFFKTSGYRGEPSEGGGALGFGNAFIFADASGVWDIDSACCVVPINHGELWARGSGVDYALGVGHDRRGDHSKDRVRRSIEAACRWDIYCGGRPFVRRL